MKHTPKHKRRKLFWQIPLLIFSIPMVWYAISLIQIQQYSKKSFNGPADVAIVLGAGSNDGIISPVFRERCKHSLTLLQNQRIAKIILTGGFGEGQATSDSEAAKRFLLKKGVKPTQILIEEKSINTIENLQFAKEIMQDNELDQALIVSDPLHMMRSMKIAELLEIHASPSPTPSSMYRSTNIQFRFLLSEAFYYCKLIIFPDRAKKPSIRQQF
ncbi:MAG: YdcF family protein [Bacteroidia bacterium]|nr:YdcF family protein [Bacteroidia bacterium]